MALGELSWLAFLQTTLEYILEYTRYQGTHVPMQIYQALKDLREDPCHIYLSEPKNSGRSRLGHQDASQEIL